MLNREFSKQIQSRTMVRFATLIGGDPTLILWTRNWLDKEKNECIAAAEKYIQFK